MLVKMETQAAGGENEFSFSGKVIQKINDSTATAINLTNIEKGKTYIFIRFQNASDYNAVSVGDSMDYTTPNPPTVKYRMTIIFRVETDNTIKQAIYMPEYFYISTSGNVITIHSSTFTNCAILEME